METVRASYSTIACEDLVAKLLPNYNLGSVEDCFYWQRGFNDTYQVVCDSGRYTLRIYRMDRRALSDIEFEIDALLHLKAQGVPVSAPLARHDGNYLTPLLAPEGVRYALITPFAKGAPLNYENHDNAFLYGQHVGEIHEKTSTFKTEHWREKIDKKTLIDIPLTIIGGFKGVNEDHTKYIAEFGAKLTDRLAAADLAGLDYGFCHGDFHGWNAHQLENSIEFFDFDFCGYGWRSYELAVFRWSRRLHGDEEKLWPMFLSGYQSKRDVGQFDLELIPVFIAIRDIWLISQHIDNAGVFARSWINDRYFSERVEFLKKIESEIF